MLTCKAIRRAVDNDEYWERAAAVIQYDVAVTLGEKDEVPFVAASAFSYACNGGYYAGINSNLQVILNVFNTDLRKHFRVNDFQVETIVPADVPKSLREINIRMCLAGCPELHERVIPNSKALAKIACARWRFDSKTDDALHAQIDDLPCDVEIKKKMMKILATFLTHDHWSVPAQGSFVCSRFLQNISSWIGPNELPMVPPKVDWVHPVHVDELTPFLIPTPPDSPH